MQKLLLSCLLATAFTVAQTRPEGVSAEGPWSLDQTASSLGWLDHAARGSLILYSQGALFLFVDRAGDPYGFSYTVGPDGGCVAFGHMPNARCEIALKAASGTVRVNSLSGAVTTIVWELSPDGKVLATQYSRTMNGESSNAKLVWRRPSPSEALQPIRPAVPATKPPFTSPL